MVAFDANLPIYAYNTASPFHRRSREWLGDTFSSGIEVGIPMQSILAFIRLATNPRLSDRVITVAEAMGVVDQWLSLPQVRILTPGPSHWSIFRRLYSETNASGRLSTDVHLAALAIEHHAVFYTNDTDFARFPGLRWQNPLIP